MLPAPLAAGWEVELNNVLEGCVVAVEPPPNMPPAGWVVLPDPNWVAAGWAALVLPPKRPVEGCAVLGWPKLLNG